MHQTRLSGASGPQGRAALARLTPRASIVTDPIESGPVALSTSSVANAGYGSDPSTTGSGSGSADDATANLPWRARLRHADNCLRDNP